MPRTDSTTLDEAPPCIAFLVKNADMCSFCVLPLTPEDSLTIDLTRMICIWVEKHTKLLRRLFCSVLYV